MIRQWLPCFHDFPDVPGIKSHQYAQSVCVLDDSSFQHGERGFCVVVDGRKSNRGLPNAIDFHREKRSEPEFSLHLFLFSMKFTTPFERQTVMRTAYLYYLCLLSLVAAGCTPHSRQAEKEQLYVSILPLRSLVEQIVGDDFKIDVLVPTGASPESFEPTPRQYVALNRSKLIFNVGLIDFEQNLLRDFPERGKLVDLSRGIRLLEGSCAHGHAHGYAHESAEKEKAHASEEHAHGIDPHIWTSPRALKQMAANAYDALRASFPDSARYTKNYERLLARLDSLDTACAERQFCDGIVLFFNET